MKEARHQQDHGHEREPGQALHEPGGAARLEQQLAGHAHAGQHRDQLSQAAPFEAHPEQAARQQIHGREHRHVCAAQRDARAGDPEVRAVVRDEQQQ